MVMMRSLHTKTEVLILLNIRKQVRCEHPVVLVKEEHFEDVIIGGRPFKKLDLSSGRYRKEIHTSIHTFEHFSNTDSFISRMNHENKGIKVHIYCAMNQLPLMSLLGDVLYLDENVKLPIYNGATMWNYQFRKFININSNKAQRVEQNFYHKKIDLYKVAERFSHAPVFIRQSSFDIFNQLELPKNIICSEVKFSSIEKKLLNDFPEMHGVRYKFQKEILEKTGHHYMSIQILASLILNWSFICVGGSANLMSLLPVKSLLMCSQEFGLKGSYRETVPITRKIYKNRYGLYLGNCVQLITGRQLEIMNNITYDTYCMHRVNKETKLSAKLIDHSYNIFGNVFPIRQKQPPPLYI